ncbi:MAG: hypothetical protein WCB12_05710 [Bryobacteraceae bacterium]
MATSTTKKAVIRRFQRESLAGYVNPLSYLQAGGVELLSADGQVVNVPYAEIKSISFVRDFDAAAEVERPVFLNRPKMEGLWMRFTFHDGEVMEGVMPNNLLPVEPYGFSVIPPHPYSAQQRVFLPRQALRAVEVLGVVGSPLKRRKQKAAPDAQIGLFGE